MDGKSALHYHVLFVAVCTGSRRYHAVGIHVSQGPEYPIIYIFIYILRYDVTRID